MADLKTNMRIWKDVCVTDPKHTKAVQKGRKFTAVDAMYQVQRATEQFGPVGEGWGYDVDYEFHTYPEGLPAPMVAHVVALVTIWHGDRSNRFGPVCAIHPLVASYRSGDQFDDDAPKKAMTDALTKGLSHLGFSADVFLGKYDDNKYVQQATEYVERQRVKRLEDWKTPTPTEGEPNA